MASRRAIVDSGMDDSGGDFSGPSEPPTQPYTNSQVSSSQPSSSGKRPAENSGGNERSARSRASSQLYEVPETPPSFEESSNPFGFGPTLSESQLIGDWPTSGRGTFVESLIMDVKDVLGTVVTLLQEVKKSLDNLPQRLSKDARTAKKELWVKHLRNIIDQEFVKVKYYENIMTNELYLKNTILQHITENNTDLLESTIPSLLDHADFRETYKDRLRQLRSAFSTEVKEELKRDYSFARDPRFETILAGRAQKNGKIPQLSAEEKVTWRNFVKASNRMPGIPIEAVVQKIGSELLRIKPNWQASGSTVALLLSLLNRWFRGEKTCGNGKDSSALYLEYVNAINSRKRVLIGGISCLEIKNMGDEDISPIPSTAAPIPPAPPMPPAPSNEQQDLGNATSEP